MQPLWKGVQERSSYCIVHLPLMGSNALRHWFMSWFIQNDGVCPTPGPQAAPSPGCNAAVSRSGQTKHIWEQSVFSLCTHQQATPTWAAQQHPCTLFQVCTGKSFMVLFNGSFLKEGKGVSNCFSRSNVCLYKALEEQLTHGSLIKRHCSPSLTRSWAPQGQRRPKLLQI